MSKILLLASLLCVSTLHGGEVTARGQTGRPAPAPSAAPAPIAQAKELLNAGKADLALETLKQLSARDPADARVNHLLGLAYYQKNDHARAIELLTPTTARLPKDGWEYRQGVQSLAQSHYILGHFREAIPYLTEAVGWAPENAELTYALGVSHVQTNNPDQARAAFARMFKVPADSAPAHLINAQMMIRYRFEETAEKELQKALALDPKLPQANFLLGELAIYRAQIDLGIGFLQKEIALNPASGMAYYRLGEAYTRQLKWDEAIPPLQKSIWLNPHFSGPYIVLGKIYLKKTDLPNAENFLRRSLEMDPNNISAHHLLAQVLQQAGRAEEAKKEFEAAERLRGSAEKK